MRNLIFTATYNERDNIIELCKTVLSLSADYEFLIVDDNSPDGTGRILHELQTTEPRLHVIHRPAKLGLGTAHKLAMLYAIKNEYDSLVTMDADWSHDPQDIPRLINGLKSYDFVTGSRYMHGGSCDYTGYRKAVSVAANHAARLLLNISTHEFTTSFRAFRIEFLKQCDISSFQSKGYSFFLEVVYKIVRQGGKIFELPIRFSDRKSGSSKIPSFEIFRGMYQLLKLTFTRFLPFRNKIAQTVVIKGVQCTYCRSCYVLKQSCLECGLDIDPSCLPTVLQPTNLIPHGN